MLDDRMEPENMKSVAASIMEQAAAPGVTGGEGDVGTDHPDKAFARGIFGESNEVSQPAAPAAQGGLDLSPLSNFNNTGNVQIREDLVQQAAQALVKDQNDAFLAITHRMTPDEVGVALQTARQWRRVDPNWQTAFRSAPETRFKFIDRNSGKGKKKPNKAEAFAHQIVGFMRENQLDPADTPKVVRRLVQEQGIQMSEVQLVQFASRIADMV